MDDDEQLVPLGSALQQMRAGELETISRQVAEDVVARKVRYPPQTATIERAIIGGMLRGGIATVLEATQQGLGSHDFSQPAHAVLFGTCVTLAQQGLPVDAVTVLAALDEDALVIVGGPLGVQSLSSAVVSAAPVADYARHLVQITERRQVLTTAATIAAAAYSKQPLVDVLSAAQASLDKVKRELPTAPGPFGELLAETRREWQQRLVHTARRWAAPAGKSMARLIVENPPPVPWMIQGLIREDSVFFIGGAPKEGKTWDAGELAMSLASGTRAFGEFQSYTQGYVLGFCLEDDERDLRNRYRALASHSADRQQALERIVIEARGSLDLLSDDDCCGIIATARSLPEAPVAIMIDPFRDANSGEENSNDDMRRVMQRVRMIRDMLRTTVILNHHMSKPGASANGKAPIAAVSLFDRFRGASAIRGAWDGALAKESVQKSPGSIWARYEVETRGGRNAGAFGLKLQLTDDAEGNATAAEYDFYRDPQVLIEESKGQKEGGEKEKPEDKKVVVLKAIRALHYAHATEEQERPAFTTAQITDTCRLPDRTVQRLIQLLAAEHRIVPEGRKWRYNTTQAPTED